jgi:hypothetical protein
MPHVDLGAGAVALAGVGPSFAIGAHGFVGLGWEHGPDFRVGFAAPQTSWSTPPGTDVQSKFTLYAVRLSGCPIALEGQNVRALPCAGLETGAHHAESLGSESLGSGRPAPPGQLIYPAASASQLFVAPFLSLRAEASYEAVFVELEAEARFPLGSHEFQLTRPGETPLRVYAAPHAAFGSLFAFGVRL